MVVVTFILYTIVAIYLGWKSHEVRGKAFWTASASLDGWSVGLSISASFMSVSWSCVYSTQLFYWYGISAFWIITLPWLVALTTIFFLAQRYRSLPAFSQPEMAQFRYGQKGKIIISLALIFVFLVWGGAEIYIAATLLSPFLHLNVSLLIIIIGLIVAIYSTAGGFNAVVRTDKFQYILVAIYIVTIAILGVNGIHSKDLSITPYISPAKSHHTFFHLFAIQGGLVLLTLLAYLPGWIFETDLWVRIQAARNTMEARKGIGIALVNSFLFVGVIPMLIAFFALILYPPTNGHIPSYLGNEGDAIFLKIVQDFAPDILILLVSLGLIAASMSTIDTCIHIVSLSLGYDLFPSDKEKLWKWNRNHFFTFIGATGTIFFALNTSSLWDLFYLSSGILSTTVALPMVGILFPKAPSKPFVYSAWSGFVSTFIFYFLEKTDWFSSLEPGVIASTGLGYILYSILLAGLVFVITFTLKKMN